VLLTYVDESYNDSWFAMAALLVDGPAAVALTDALDRVAAASARAYGLDAGVELHENEIFHAGGAWGGVPVRARVGAFDDVVEAVAAHDVRVIARAMDIVGQRARYQAPDPPHTVILQHLLERVDECATRLGDYALVIADEVNWTGEAPCRPVELQGGRHDRIQTPQTDTDRGHPAFRPQSCQPLGASHRCDHIPISTRVHAQGDRRAIT
jgi:hypothetical protein